MTSDNRESLPTPTSAAGARFEKSVIADTNRRVFARIEAAERLERMPVSDPRPIGWQWKTVDGWRTVDGGDVSDPEEYARSMAGEHGHVRAIFNRPEGVEPGSQVLFGIYDAILGQYLTEVFLNPFDALTRAGGAETFLRARPLYAALPADLVDVSHTIQKSRIREVEAEFGADGGACGWRSCTGCHEHNEGQPQGLLSPIFGVHAGIGCHECGGLGVVWEYWSAEALDRMARDLGEEAEPVEVGVEWMSLDTCPSSGTVWVCGGTSTEPELKEADGEYWRQRREKGLSHPTHWHPVLLPKAPGVRASAH